MPDNPYHLPRDETKRRQMIAQREKLIRDFRYVGGGLAGTSILFMVTIVAVPRLDFLLTLAVACFAVTLPALIGMIVYADYLPQARGVWMLLGLGSAGASIGIGATIWHTSLAAGIAYVLTILVVVGMLFTKRFGSVRDDFERGVLREYYSGEERLPGPETREHIHLPAEGGHTH